MANIVPKAAGPYPGQRPYRTVESANFFGRDHAAHAVAELWREHRLTVLSGSPGVGKTSLLQAGVLPLVDVSDLDVLPVGRVKDESVFPVAALSEHNRYVLALLASWAVGEPRTRLSRMSISDFLQRRMRRHGATARLIAIDQFDDLLRDGVGAASDREWFLTELAGALVEHPDVHLLVVARQERLPFFLDSLLVPDASVSLEAFHPDTAVDVIRRPFARVGQPVSLGAAEALVDRLCYAPMINAALDRSVVREVVVEPALLQAVCTALWGALGDHRGTVTVASALSLVDVDQCLAEFVIASTAAAANDHEIAPWQLLAWLATTFTARGAKTIAEEPGGFGQRLAILRALEDRHVLRAKPGQGPPIFALTSDRLLVPVQLAVTMLVAIAPVTASSTDRLAASVRALADGNLDLGGRQAHHALDTSFSADLRLKAEAETVLGNIAFLSRDPVAARGHYTAAAEFFEALQDRVAVGHLLGAVGRMHLLDWDPAAAVAALHSAAVRLRTDGVVMLDLARAFASSGESHAALAMLGSVLTADPDVTGEDAHLLRGEILADVGDAAEALRDLGQVSRDQPLSALAARAFSLARLGRLDDAEKGIQHALRVGRDNGPVLLRAAQIQALRGDMAEAGRLLRRAIEATKPELNRYQRMQADSLKEECSV